MDKLKVKPTINYFLFLGKDFAKNCIFNFMQVTTQPVVYY